MSRFLLKQSIILLCILGYNIAQAQITNVTDDQAPPIQGAGHDYIKMFNETVAPATGSVSININVPAPPSRGFSVPFAFEYDSNAAMHRLPGFPGTWTDNANEYAAKSGWSYVVPKISAQINQILYSNPGGAPYQCYYMTGLTFVDNQGGSHAPAIAPDEQANTGNCVYSNVGSPPPWHPYDNYLGAADAMVQGTTTRMIAGGVPNPITLVDKDGLVYYFGGLTGTATGLPTYMEDRNGNKASFHDQGSGKFTVTDTTGRVAISTSGFGTSGNTVTVSGLTGPYTVTWGTFRPSTTLTNSYQTLLVSPWPSGYGSCPASPPSQQTFVQISKLTLPNGLSYQFQYDPVSSLISKIIYPNGAYIRYVWQKNLKSQFGILTASGDTTHSPDCEERYDSWAVQNRYVSFDGTNEVLEQDYLYTTNWVTCPSQGAVCVTNGQLSWNQKTTTVTTTVSTVSNGTLQSLGSYKTVYKYSPFYVPPTPDSGTWYGSSATSVESEVDYFDFNGAQIRTVKKTWVDPQLPPNETVALDNGQTSQTTYTFQSHAQSYFANNPLGCNISCLDTETDIYNYDYGPGAPGALLKQMHIDYASFGNIPLYTQGPSIFDRPSDVITYDGSGSRIAETDYGYDGIATSPATAIDHDETNYSPSYNGRGNATTKTAQCIGCTNAVSTYTYDETGQVLSRTDPCGNTTCSDMTGSVHTTNYGYSDSYTILSAGQNVSYTPTQNTNAYLTSMTDPLGHAEQFTYDYNNGQLTILNDQNSQPTSYIYNDSLSRPTQENLSDGGQTTISYNDLGSSPTVTTTTLINSTTTKTIVNTMDGLGHVVQTALNSDPDGVDYTDIAYDGIGHVHTQSNPHRSTSSTTDGTTTYTYDSLGRTGIVSEPDGSTVSTSYSGNQATVIDEVLNKRTTQSDGLGRLTDVWEAPNVTGYNFASHYVYSALDNLLCAVQKGTDTTAFTTCAAAPATWRPRSFAYDSLSRLTSATNPQTGAVGYSYDANGNVATKTAPSPNQAPSGNSVVIGYTYDAVNRLISKGYTDSYAPNPATMPAIYGYDGHAISGCPSQAPPGDVDSYPIGRRTAMCDGSGATNWTHDKMGRILQERRTIGTVAGKNDTDVYNLDGSVASLTSLGFQVTYAYNGAGRPLSALGGNSFVQSNSATYAPFGGLASAKMGPTPIVVTNKYNNRLQPLLISASAGSSIISLCYDFHMVAVPNPNTDCSLPVGLGNNGNVFKIVNNRDNNRTENFLYDPLNRISQAYTSGPNWGETFGPTATAPGVQPTSSGIDAWGNLTNRSGVTGKGTYEGLSAAPATVKNQLNGYCHDSAGNLVLNNPCPQGSFSQTYTYDSENRLITTAGISYIYDGDGKRVKKCTAGTIAGTCATNAVGTLYWSVPGGGTLTETDLAGNTLQNYVFFNGMRIARRDASGTVHFYFSDHLGTHSLITDLQGDMPPQEESDYYPYGGEIPVSGSDSNHYKFTGKERDIESGLDNFGARYDASSSGRFMTPDALGGNLVNPQSLNKYPYVYNNPLRYIDPTGMYVCADDPKDKSTHCASKQDKAFEKALAGLRGKEGDVGRAAAAYGAMNDDNGVTVGFADLTSKGEGGGTVSTIGSDDQGNLRANSAVTISSKLKGADFDAAIGHEGSHAADAQDVVKSGITEDGQALHAGQNITPYQSEQRAYDVTNAILSQENESRNYCGGSPCILGRGVITGTLSGVIDSIVANDPLYNQGGKPMSSSNQGPSVVNGVTPTPPKASVPH